MTRHYSHIKAGLTTSLAHPLAWRVLFLSGRQDSNLRSPTPKAGAIPGYATTRIKKA